MVVPMFAPIITPADWRRVIKPAFTKLTVITVVTEEDWTIEVIPNPVKTPLTLFDVMEPSIDRNRLPAACCKPSLISFIPKMKNANAPISMSNLATPQPRSVLVFVFADHTIWSLSSSNCSVLPFGAKPILNWYLSAPFRFLISYFVSKIEKGSVRSQSPPPTPFFALLLAISFWYSIIALIPLLFNFSATL